MLTLGVQLSKIYDKQVSQVITKVSILCIFLSFWFCCLFIFIFYTSIPKVLSPSHCQFPISASFPFFLPSSPSSQLYFVLMWLILFSSPILGLSSNKLLALCYFPLSFCVDSRHNCSPLKKKNCSCTHLLDD